MALILSVTWHKEVLEGTMFDWIERWFGISPDNGDGSLEMLYLIALVLCAGALLAAYPPVRRAIRLRLGLSKQAHSD
jgi:hypothetical protein